MVKMIFFKKNHPKYFVISGLNKLVKNLEFNIKEKNDSNVYTYEGCLGQSRVEKGT